ncbi:RagB/SusD family nutrient uptake outer membrane protein [Candidatus Symbiothrix dinenymphae]|uniref:RagB/SusD family nutrient uptake outer membrane protein n=1 Tax=Candidatus Symbiothrix dinenymphae TaxID=467085 RepID=UPI0006C0E764|nr:RagB/SusD family nutrient uptake outer membrane protein [Candidatus Symbiothrix dinenymphae]GAP73391.1 RagB/SusD domain-containing protein [Candidatus Symbiothrix dinenymphae]
MKKLELIVLIICAGLVSCDDFLTQDPYTSMSEDAAISDNITANYALVGIYDRFQSEYLYGRNYLGAPDATTENVILAPNGVQLVAEAQWSMTNATGDAADMWLYGYSAINAANKILSKVDGIVATDEQKQQIKGEALVIRGMVHLDLVRIFAQAYPGSENGLGIPYIKVSSVYEKPARDKISDVYTNIIADLQEGAGLLTQSGKDNAPYRINSWAAKALLAKAHMMKLDYAAAKPILKDIIDNSGYSILENANYVSAWANKYNATAKKEFLFAISNLSTDYLSALSLSYLYVQDGYGNLRASDNLVTLYESTDVRKTAFFLAGTGAMTGSTMVNKYPSREGMLGLSDIPLVRLSDIYLYYAEASAYTGDDVTAITYLDIIRQRADASATASTETGNALKDKIFLERRKELAFEGEYLFDLKRYQKTINSAYNASNVLYKVVPYPSELRAFPIPQGELDANPNMEPNPGY